MIAPDTPSLPPHSPAQEGLIVSAEEAGMKLLRFLERRLEGHAAKSALHKWIRTGQVRVNKGRSAPYRLLEQGDIVRIPPFALARDVENIHLQESCEPTTEHSDYGERGGRDESACISKCNDKNRHSGNGGPDGKCEQSTNGKKPLFLGKGLKIVSEQPSYLVLAKAGGLPVQPGSGVDDSVVTRLRQAFAGHVFIPAPAHRLDRHTSGLVVAGKTHLEQKRLHELFRENQLEKNYLAWVRGAWPWQEARFCCDVLQKGMLSNKKEGIIASAENAVTEAAHDSRSRKNAKANACCIVTPIMPLPADAALPVPEATLVMVALLTGHKHQIRVQLASRGFPIIGDGRYGGPSFSHMLLHAYSLGIPETDDEWKEFSALPAWESSLVPSQDALDAASAQLALARKSDKPTEKYYQASTD